MGMQCFYEYFMYYASKNVIQSIAHIGSLHIFYISKAATAKISLPPLLVLKVY